MIMVTTLTVNFYYMIIYYGNMVFDNSGKVSVCYSN